MKALVCEMCESNDIVKQDGMYVCQHCGTKYTVEEAKKLLVDGVVKVDNSDNLRNYYQLARRAKENGNTEDGAKYYDMIRQLDPNSWEANYYSVYFTSMSCVIAHISSAATALANCIGSVLMLIKENCDTEDDIKAAVEEVFSSACDAAEKFNLASTNTFLSIDDEHRAQYVHEFSDRVFSAVAINTELASNLKKVFGEELWVLGKMAAAFYDAKKHLSAFKRNLKPMLFLNRAPIHGMMEEQASLMIAENEVLYDMYKQKIKDLKHENINAIEDVNERFKALLLEDTEMAVELFDSVTLSKEEMSELANSDDYLCAAVLERSVEQVEMLLKMGADPYVSQTVKSNIYCLAVLGEQNSNSDNAVKILNLLLDYGAVPTDGDYNDKTNPLVKKVLLEKYPELKPASNASNGGCYVATAVYGSYDCPEVWTLRRFRDYTLAETWHGRTFIRTYYAVSPTLVKWFGKTEWFKNIWKPTLDRMVEKLNRNGVSDTPYNDREW